MKGRLAQERIGCKIKKNDISRRFVLHAVKYVQNVIYCE